jgi:hypothetical protein
LVGSVGIVCWLLVLSVGSLAIKPGEDFEEPFMMIIGPIIYGIFAKVHGPVKTLKSDFATWDRDRQDWQAAEHVTVASFHPDGTISNTDAHNTHRRNIDTQMLLSTTTSS